MSKEAMKLALEVLEGVLRGDYNGNADKAIAVLQEALVEQPAQPQQEPATDTELINRGCHYQTDLMQPAQPQEPVATLFGSLPVYDTPLPAQRTWVGLTDIEYDNICGRHSAMTDFDFLEDIEAKLKEKNT